MQLIYSILFIVNMYSLLCALYTCSILNGQIKFNTYNELEKNHFPVGETNRCTCNKRVWMHSLFERKSPEEPGLD